MVDCSIKLSALQILFMNELDLFEVDQFVKKQEHTIEEFERFKVELIDQLADSLCRQSEMHILDVKAPKSISIEKFRDRAGLSPEVRLHLNLADMSLAQSSVVSQAIADFTNSESVENNLFQPSISEMGSAVLNSMSIIGDEALPSFSKKIAMVSYTEKGKIRNGCRKFAALMRLSDFILRNGLYDSAEHALLDLRAFISNRIKISSMKTIIDFPISTEVATVGRDSIPLIKLTITLSSSFVSILGGGKFIDSQYGLIRNKQFNENASSSVDSKMASLMLSSSSMKYETIMNPDKEDIITKVRKVLLKVRKCGMDSSRLTECPSCVAIVEPIRQETANTSTEPNETAQEMIITNDSLHLHIDKICQIIIDDYDRCLEYITKYNLMCDRYERNVKTFDSSETGRLLDVAPDAIVAMLTGFKNDIEAAEDICTRQNFGCFRLNFAQFKAQIRKQAETCIALFSRLVPDLYVNSGESLFKDLNQLSNPLSSDFHSLDEYVHVAEIYNKATVENEALSVRFLYVMALKDIIDNFKMPNTDAVVRQNLTVFNAWARFSQLLTDFEGILSDNATVYKTELRNRARALVDTLARIKAALQAEYVNSPESDPETVLQQLGHLKIELIDVQERAKLILKYQLDLNYKVFNNDVVSEVDEQLNTTFVLWSVLKSVKELQVSYMAVNFLDAASEDVQKQLSLAVSTLNGIQSRSDKILLWLQKTVSDLLFVAPIIRKLQSNTQKEIHTNKIHQLLGRHIFDDEDVTVGELVDVVHIVDYTEQLENIYEEAQFLHNLELKVAEVLKACQAKEFTFKAVALNRTIVHIDNFDEIGEFYENASLTVRSCMQSKFAKTSLRDFEAVQFKINQWISVNNKYKQLQDSFNRLRLIFFHAKTARYFSSGTKHFKLVEECWRNFSKLAKTEVRAADIYSIAGIEDPITVCTSAVAAVDQVINAYLNDQYIRWPKLHLIDRDYFLEIISTHDPHDCFMKCRTLFPHLTGISFQPFEPLNAISVHSNEETIEFKKACSARVSLVDWITAINGAISERLESDIMKFVNDIQLLYEDLRSPKASEQSKICALQVKFWKDFLAHLASPSRQVLLRTFLTQLKDQMSIFSTNMANYYAPYHIKSISNLITVLINQRELVSKLIQEDFGNDFEIPFFIECSVKKMWNIGVSPLQVCQAQIKMDYGMHYRGYCDRLVVTPLTDKCFLAITFCMRNGQIPFLSGQHGVGKSSFVNYLTYELGYETLNYDCRILGSMASLFNYFRAALGCTNGIWMTISNADCLSQNVYAGLLSVLSSVQLSLTSRSNRINLGGASAVISDNKNLPPRFCVLYNTTIAKKGDDIGLPTSLRKQFRQLNMQRPPDIRRSIIVGLLTANNFSSVPKVTERICGMYDHLVENRLVRESVLFRTILESIRYASEKNFVSITAPSLHSAMLAKVVISRIPHHLQQNITESDLRFVCNLFLEITYSRDTDLKDFKPSARGNVVEEQLVEYLMLEPRGGCENLSNTRSLILLSGAVNSGKSSIIRDTINTAISENHRQINLDAAIYSKSSENSKNSSRSKLSRYERIVNPFLLTHLEEGQLQENATLRLYDDAVCEVIGKLVEESGSNEGTLIFHFDCHSSLLISGVLPRLVEFVNKSEKKVKFIWEISELDHIDPNIVTNIPLLHLSERRFSEGETIQFHSNKLSSR